MICHVKLDMPKIEKARRRKHDPVPDTLAALGAAGFKPKYRQGTLFERFAMIRGTVENEQVVLKLRSIPFIIFARKVC